jgi:hypothetical protein
MRCETATQQQDKYIGQLGGSDPSDTCSFAPLSIHFSYAMVKQLSTVCGTAHDLLTLYDDTLVTLPCQNLIWSSPCAVTYATAATVKACPYTSHHRVKPCHLICTSDLLLFTVQVCQHVLNNSHSTAIYTVHSHWNSHETHTTPLTASEQPSPCCDLIDVLL